MSTRLTLGASASAAKLSIETGCVLLCGMDYLCCASPDTQPLAQHSIVSENKIDKNTGNLSSRTLG